jgi:hypothetical protein
MNKRQRKKRAKKRIVLRFEVNGKIEEYYFVPWHFEAHMRHRPQFF